MSTTPRIIITRHWPGFYEWTVIVDQEQFDNEVGDTSIADCLSSAVYALPEDLRLVEVCYRGLHMGTFEVLELEHCAEDVAARIAATHGALTHDN